MKFVYYKTKTRFDQDNEAGLVDKAVIAFIEDERLIWSHDKFFNCGGTDISYVSEEDIRSIVESHAYADGTMERLAPVNSVNSASIVNGSIRLEDLSPEVLQSWMESLDDEEIEDIWSHAVEEAKRGSSDITEGSNN
jgi:hypothetical protein